MGEALSPGLLSNKTAWITGGGTGLGRAMALRFSKLGAAVAICGRREEPLTATVDEIHASGGKATSACCDVRDPQAVDAVLAKVVEDLGGLDILVNNAAGNFLCPAEELTPNGFAAVVGIVLHGTFHCTHAAGRYWIENKRPGAVLSIATTYAWTGSAFVLPSACAKAGVVALTRSLAVEWARYGIRLNAIAPGPIPTEGAFSRLLPTPEFEEARKKKIPAGRFGTPEELAECVCFLLSERSNFMAGQTIVASGGRVTIP